MTQQNIDQLLEERGVPTRGHPVTNGVGADILARAVDSPLELRVAGCPPIVLLATDPSTGEDVRREYQRRRPTLKELERLEADHARVSERIERGETPTRSVIVQVLAYVMVPGEAERLVEKEDFATVVKVAARVASFVNNEPKE